MCSQNQSKVRLHCWNWNVRRLQSGHDLVIARINHQPCTPKTISLKSHVQHSRCQFCVSFANSVPLSVLSAARFGCCN